MKSSLQMLLNVLAALAALCSLAGSASSSQAAQCNPGALVYGEDGLVDELLTCSLANTLDLDLTPQAEQLKSTSRALLDQGLSNKTTIIHARLSGLWTARRPGFIRTGWRCGSDSVSATSIIELSGVSLEVVERLDMPLHRSQHKLALHRPCKTFDLPTWMCRQSKPIYRTISTWVNRAYFNLTLTQGLDEARPSVTQLVSMFTCPETFKQKITHSPSSAYLLTRHLHQAGARPTRRTVVERDTTTTAAAAAAAKTTMAAITTTATSKVAGASGGGGRAHARANIVEEMPSLGHPTSFTTTQSGGMPGAPHYQNSVRTIMGQVTSSLEASLVSCINSIDSDLRLLRDHKSFESSQFAPADAAGQPEDDNDQHHQHQHHNHNHHESLLGNASKSFGPDDTRLGLANECSNRRWIESRIELTNQASAMPGYEPAADTPTAPTGPRPQRAANFVRALKR